MLRHAQRLPIVSFGFFLSFAAATAVLIHQVSPLRNPAFQPNSGNAGSLLPSMRGIRESIWLEGSSILAVLLAVSLTLVLRQWSEAQSRSDARQNPSRIAGSLLFMRWLIIGSVLFMTLWLVIIQYSYPFFGGAEMAPPIIAALLAVNFTFIFWLWNQLEGIGIFAPWNRGATRTIAQAFLIGYWMLIGTILYLGFERLFVGYLLAQWLVD